MKLNKEAPLQVGDKVRVMRKEEGKENKKENKKERWDVLYEGIITQTATRGWVKVFDPKRTDSNVGFLGDSEEWVHSDCKMIKVVRD